MHVIKLDATDSTNAHLRRLLSSGAPVDYTVVTTIKQEQGRGQMGTVWQSEAGKNLTFSVLRRNLCLDVDQGFILNLCVSLAIYSVLKDLGVPDLSIKWPNDILSGTDKLCGILIENKISGSTITISIIGIGLNVNQLEFNKLENVSSLKLLLDGSFDLDKLLHKVISGLMATFSRWENEGPDALWDNYKKLLFRKGKLSTFEDDSGESFRGYIEGVTPIGKLIVALEGNGKREFGLKEISLPLQKNS